MKKQIPINRVNKFFTAEDFQLENSFLDEYIAGDLNMSVILYRVNRSLTKTDSIYGETVKDGIIYYPPIEIKCVVDFLEPENKSYNADGSLRYQQDGDISLTILDQHLNNLKVDIIYGDYIGYSVNETTIRYFSVVDDGKKNYNNSNTILGYKAAYRIVLCAPVDRDEFRGL